MRVLGIVIILGASFGQAIADGPWASVAGGYGSYNLGEITDAPTTYRGYRLEPGSMDSGSRLSAALGYDFSHPWSLSFAYERNSASTAGVSGDATVEADMPMHALKINPCWYPVELSYFRFGVGAGLGVGFIRGTVATTGNTYGGLEGDLRAADLLTEGTLVTEYRPTQNLTFQLLGGFREVSFGELTIGGVPVKRDDNSEIAEFDYSGWFGQIGLKYLLPKGNAGI